MLISTRMNISTKHINPETLKLIDEQARSLGISPDEYLCRLLPSNEQELALKADATSEEFESDMLAFADGTENLATDNGTYSREDIYLDHD